MTDVPSSKRLLDWMMAGGALVLFYIYSFAVLWMLSNFFPSLLRLAPQPGDIAGPVFSLVFYLVLMMAVAVAAFYTALRLVLVQDFTAYRYDVVDRHTRAVVHDPSRINGFILSKTFRFSLIVVGVSLVLQFVTMTMGSTGYGPKTNFGTGLMFILVIAVQLWAFLTAVRAALRLPHPTCSLIARRRDSGEVPN